MKIAILSKADRFGGGASRVADELCELLRLKGHIAHHYLSVSQDQSAGHQRSLYGNFFIGRYIRRLNRLVKAVGFPELVPWELFFLWLRQIKSYDLIHFHDLSSAISPLTVRYLARKIPAVWTFHDCSPFTGGCLYPMGCERFKTECGQCPQLGQWPLDTKIDFTSFMQAVKRKTALERNFIAVTPSTWMALMAVSSGTFITPPLVIPNGVDTDLFKPIDKFVIRKKLGLPTDRYIILVLASFLGEERKGTKYALESLARIKDLNPYLLIIGQVDNTLSQTFNEFECLMTGYIKNNQKKAEYFAAADLFLFCSLADNMPLVVLETMAVATPTVGFATGGVPEMIEHNDSGYLARPKDIEGLAQGLRLGLMDKQVPLWGKQARKKVEQSFSHSIFLSNHLELYERAITSKDHKRYNGLY